MAGGDGTPTIGELWLGQSGRVVVYGSSGLVVRVGYCRYLRRVERRGEGKRLGRRKEKQNWPPAERSGGRTLSEWIGIERLCGGATC